MSVLLMGPELREAVARVRAHAEHRGNWYEPCVGSVVPGDTPVHTVRSGTIKAVFTWTLTQDTRILRHLSVSTATGGAETYPAPLAVFTIAHLFGFTGAQADDNGLVHSSPKHWTVGGVRAEQCIMVLEELSANALADLQAYDA